MKGISMQIYKRFYVEGLQELHFVVPCTRKLRLVMHFVLVIHKKKYCLCF